MKKSDFWGAVGIFVMYLLSLTMIMVSIIGLCIYTTDELLVQSILTLILGLFAHILIVIWIYAITREEK